MLVAVYARRAHPHGPGSCSYCSVLTVIARSSLARAVPAVLRFRMDEPLPISFDDVAAAGRRLAGIAHRTPVLRSGSANERTGATLFFKCENLQRIGAFKIRGAYNAIAQFTPEQRRG